MLNNSKGKKTMTKFLISLKETLLWKMPILTPVWFEGHLCSSTLLTYDHLTYYFLRNGETFSMCVIKKDKHNHNIICVISLFCLKCNQIVNPRTFCWPYSIQYFASGLQIKEIISSTQQFTLISLTWQVTLYLHVIMRWPLFCKISLLRFNSTGYAR